MNTATFFLSTGRCGTQWLAENLSALSAGSAVIEHEPLHSRYYPRLMHGSNDPEKTGNAEEINRHCERIEEILEDKSYIECGWPAWGAIPYLLRRFKGKINIVHLVRHPVPVACSWVSHRAFCPPLIPLPHLQEKILATPFDDGTAFPHYCEQWTSMNPFEKSLFFWLEINALGLKLEKEAHAPWLRIRFEDLFYENAMQNLVDFLGLTAQENTSDAFGKVKDNFHYACDTWWRPQDIQKYPDIVKTAMQLSYDPLDFDEEKLWKRYYPFLTGASA
ncbi:MAG: hypothetical protein ACXWF8_04045 [Methylobacter sp.]